MERASINEIFDHLQTVIESDRFLNKEGLGNEVPFFICPYSPKLAAQIDELRANLINQLQRSGIIVLDINLYDMAVEKLRERNIWQRILEAEPTRTKKELLELLRNVLDPEMHLVPEIADRMTRAGNFHVLFLSGVGEVFPYIRSHTILNNLQSTAKDQPTIMFFPGQYTHSLETGASLDLFGRLKDDRYYRAFNILHYNV